MGRHVPFLIDVESTLGYERPSRHRLSSDHADWFVTIASFPAGGSVSPAIG